MTNPTKFSELPWEIKYLLDISLITGFLCVLFLSAYLVACYLGVVAGVIYALVVMGAIQIYLAPKANQRGPMA